MGKVARTTLEEIALGDMTPDEALAELREIVGAEKTSNKRIVHALQEVVFKILRADAGDTEQTRRWLDVCRWCEVSLRGEDATSASVRIEAFGDLLARSIRFDELQPIDETLPRRETVKALRAMDIAGEPVGRKALADATGLPPLPLSRFLAILECARLTSRTSWGLDAQFVLTHRGKAALLEMTDEDGSSGTR